MLDNHRTYEETEFKGGFLRSAIYQIIAINPDVPEVAATLYEKHLGLQKPANEELSEVFMALVFNSKVFAIVDAIDECPKQERSSFFRVFVDKLESKVNLLMTSRRELDIEKALSGKFPRIVSIEDSRVDEDVRIHVANAAPNGNFELVDFLLDNGADIMNLDGYAFRKVVQGGEKMLLHLLKRVPSEHREKALDSALQQSAYCASLELCKFSLDIKPTQTLSGASIDARSMLQFLITTWATQTFQTTGKLYLSC
ncbi:uncharacterized protein DFL_008432 [Arthrobotrys flagrans]|uniref:Nephrocystin 3-like N-terminal domain-containing protein n=1 Tax=Arthrobotrys flagrans TaxID=97331 RepID=A0A436ZNQ4_ARTFL|nr:hypothetical protein DFL_008432 [Arthrobotrys flagrans]